jgi:hypothetical protein
MYEIQHFSLNERTLIHVNCLDYRNADGETTPTPQNHDQLNQDSAFVKTRKAGATGTVNQADSYRILGRLCEGMTRRETHLLKRALLYATPDRVRLSILCQFCI